jgi:hypothetical protein
MNVADLRESLSTCGVSQTSDLPLVFLIFLLAFHSKIASGSEMARPPQLQQHGLPVPQSSSSISGSSALTLFESWRSLAPNNTGAL